MARRNDHTQDELKDLTLKSAISIITAEGSAQLTARRLAKEIGYTPGTLYNLFGSMDGLYLNINAQTLDKLSAHLSDASQYGSADDVLQNLKTMAKLYMDFANKNKALWLLMFTRASSQTEKPPEWYKEKVAEQFQPLENLIAPLFQNKNEAEKKLASRALWSSVHGICFMQFTDKTELIIQDDALRVSEYLIENFIKGLQNTRN